MRVQGVKVKVHKLEVLLQVDFVCDRVFSSSVCRVSEGSARCGAIASSVVHRGCGDCIWISLLKFVNDSCFVEDIELQLQKLKK